MSVIEAGLVDRLVSLLDMEDEQHVHCEAVGVLVVNGQLSMQGVL